LARLTVRLGLDPDLPVEPSESVKQLAQSPESYIVAIRTYREQSGVGLVEAKAVVDGLRKVSVFR
jgi:ribosomal protein L7/L12